MKNSKITLHSQSKQRCKQVMQKSERDQVRSTSWSAGAMQDSVCGLGCVRTRTASTSTALATVAVCGFGINDGSGSGSRLLVNIICFVFVCLLIDLI